MSRRTLLLILAILAALAVSSLRLSMERQDSSPWVGDFPSARRSNRGPVPVSLPFVVGLVVPSAQVRMRANRETRRAQSQALQQSRVLAWFPARRCRWRYGSNPQLWLAQVLTARDACGSAEVVGPHLRSASLPWADRLPIRCQTPGMQATAQGRMRRAQQYRGEEHGCVCVQDARQYCHRSVLTRERRYRS